MTWKTYAVIFAVAVAFNFPWETLQAPLYRMETAGRPPWLHCLRASLGDGLLVLLILVLGAGILGRLDWFRRPGSGGYAWMLVSGVIFAVALEWTAVHMLKRWSYEPAMPLLPGLDIGVVPIVQMLAFAAGDLRRRGPAHTRASRWGQRPGQRTSPRGGMMRSKLWVNAVLMSLAVLAACARKEQAPAATGGESAATPAAGVEKTYPLRGKVVSLDAARNEITVDHEKIEGLWEPMTMAFEVRGGEPGSLPAEGSTIRATLHAQDGRYWLTDVRTE